MTFSKLIVLVPALFLGGLSAWADTVTFTFDAQTINGQAIAALSSGANAAQIKAYMDNVLSAAGCTGCSVTVTGAVADQTYTGDNHVVGPTSGNGRHKIVTPVTLGTTDGATSNSSTAPGAFDTFIANTNDSSGFVSSQITLRFNGFSQRALSIDSFDFEIFPDGSADQPPDFIFEAGNNITGTDPTVASFGTNGTRLGVLPSSGTNGTNSMSCLGNSSSNCGGNTGVDHNAQYIGTWTAGISGVSELDFIDWPATIGVDRLSITYDAPPVPEPTSVLLLGTVVAGLLLRKRLQKA